MSFGQQAEPEDTEGYGDYHALLIGNDQCAHMPDLKTTIGDAEAVAEVLRDDYGFTVTPGEAEPGSLVPRTRRGPALAGPWSWLRSRRTR
jgi:hypothetical protein